MEEKTMMPINNQIEPDFLEHIKSTFKRWRDLNTQGVTIGARELSNFAFTLKGASMNSHLGFKYNFNPRGTDTDGNPAITLKLYTKPEQMSPAADRPVYEFAAPYMVLGCSSIESEGTQHDAEIKRRNHGSSQQRIKPGK